MEVEGLRPIQVATQSTASLLPSPSLRVASGPLRPASIGGPMRAAKSGSSALRDAAERRFSRWLALSLADRCRSLDAQAR